MSLVPYWINLSVLDPEEYTEVYMRIDRLSNDGIHEDRKSGGEVFMLDEARFPTTLLRVPDKCQLRRL